MFTVNGGKMSAISAKKIIMAGPTPLKGRKREHPGVISPSISKSPKTLRIARRKPQTNPPPLKQQRARTSPPESKANKYGKGDSDNNKDHWDRRGERTKKSASSSAGGPAGRYGGPSTPGG